MNKLIVTFLLASVCAVLLVSYASAEADEKLVPIDNVPAELKMPLESILDGLRVRRAAQAGQGQGQGRRGPPSDGQNGQQGGQNSNGN